MTDSISADATTIAHGSCLCGAIMYDITAEPSASAICHCVSCQKASGTAYSCTLYFKDDKAVTISDPQNHLKWYEDKTPDSGKSAGRAFCSQCGSSMFDRMDYASTGPSHILVLSGTVDDIQDKWKPQLELYTDRRRSWMPALEGTACFTRMLPRAAS